MADCVFCNKKLTDGATVTLGDKGCEGITKASIQRESSVVVKPGDVVHRECRRKFCHPSEIERSKRKHSSDSVIVPLSSLQRIIFVQGPLFVLWNREQIWWEEKTI